MSTIIEKEVARNAMQDGLKKLYEAGKLLEDTPKVRGDKIPPLLRAMGKDISALADNSLQLLTLL